MHSVDWSANDHLGVHLVGFHTREGEGLDCTLIRGWGLEDESESHDHHRLDLELANKFCRCSSRSTLNIARHVE